MEAVQAATDADVAVPDTSDRIVTDPPWQVEEHGTPTERCAL